jgi:hypothetical protein
VGSSRVQTNAGTQLTAAHLSTHAEIYPRIHLIIEGPDTGRGTNAPPRSTGVPLQRANRPGFGHCVIWSRSVFELRILRIHRAQESRRRRSVRLQPLEPQWKQHAPTSARARSSALALWPGRAVLRVCSRRGLLLPHGILKGPLGVRYGGTLRACLALPGPSAPAFSP